MNEEFLGHTTEGIGRLVACSGALAGYLGFIVLDDIDAASALPVDPVRQLPRHAEGQRPAQDRITGGFPVGGVEGSERQLGRAAIGTAEPHRPGFRAGWLDDQNQPRRGVADLAAAALRRVLQDAGSRQLGRHCLPLFTPIWSI